MTKYALAALAALLLVSAAPAQGHETGAKMGHHPAMAGMHGQMMGAMAVCMHGLSSDEMKQAHTMMKGWSAAERDAWHQRCTLCMADPHTALMKMEKAGKQPTDAMVHQHMMSGLSKGQQAAMGKIMADGKDKAILMKMAENCCMYGVKHASKGK